MMTFLSSRNSKKGGQVMSVDDYYTPQWCIDAIVGEVLWRNVEIFLEPCSGDGRIFRSVIDMRGPDRFVSAEGFDIVPFSEGRRSVDYLAGEREVTSQPFRPRESDLCLTNPPFSKWVEFAVKALQDCKSVIMLGKLSMLGTATRRDFWLRNQLSHMWCLSERPAFEGPARKREEEAALAEGRKLSKTDNSEYAWFGWRCESVAWRAPGIYHI